MSIRSMADFPRNEQGLVDNFIGSAYDVVKGVYDALPELNQIYEQVGLIPTIAEDSVETAMIPARAEIAGLVQGMDDLVDQAADSAALAADNADRANAINVLYPFALVSGQIQYDVRVISGNPSANTASMALWVEGAIDFAFTVDSTHLFTLTNTLELGGVAQMGIILNARFNDVVRNMEELEQSFELQFAQFLENASYENPVPYTAGILIQRSTQTFSKDGDVFAPKAGAIPFTTTNWGVDQLKVVSVGDAVVRQDLNDPTTADKNAGMIKLNPSLLYPVGSVGRKFADLSDPTVPEHGTGLLGHKRSPLSVSVHTAAMMLNAQTVNLWEFTDYVTNFASYATNPWACDWAPALMAAFATGKKVYAPSVDLVLPYVIKSVVVLPKVVCNLVGDGDSSLFILDAVMDSAFVRLDDGTLECKAAVLLDNFKLDCNRKANWGLRIEASLKGGLKNITVSRFLAGGAILGSDSGGTAGYYENDISNPSFDAGLFYANDLATMASYGVYLGLSATDNTLYHPVSKYIKETGVYSRGGSNKIIFPHAFGSNTADTGPKYCVIAEAPNNEIIDSHNDNPTVAGISIRSNSVSVTGGTYQWAFDNVPAVGGAVPIEVMPGLAEINIIGGTVRGANVSNPTIRYLGAKPLRSTVMGISPFSPMAGEDMFNYINRQFGLTGRPGARTIFSIDAPVDSSAVAKYLRNSSLRYEFGTTSGTESGSNAGTDYTMTWYKDDGTLGGTAYKYFRQFQLHEFTGQIKLGTTNVGFYGANPVGKPTVSGAKAGNTALASLITALATLGLITDTTT